MKVAVLDGYCLNPGDLSWEVTPHIAWATREAPSRLMERAIASIRAFISGEPRNMLT